MKVCRGREGEEEQKKQRKDRKQTDKKERETERDGTGHHNRTETARMPTDTQVERSNAEKRSDEDGGRGRGK